MEGTDLASDLGAAPNARPVFNQQQRWALLAAFALILIFRLPRAWAHGRFQDEEATVFLAYAWHHPWVEALFRPFAGYWNLGAAATTVTVVELVRGGIVPLERAPYLTMGVALGFQLLPAVLILTGKAQWLTRRAAVIAALLIVAIAPATEEVFFNVLHIQFHMALCAALILAFDVPQERGVRIGYGLLLFLAPLCGPGAIVILPLFAMRAAIDRDRGRLTQLAIFAAGAAIQLVLFYGSSPLRGHVAGPSTIAAAMFVRLITLPLTGMNFANAVANAISASRGFLFWVTAVTTILLFGALLVMAAQRRDGALWLMLAALTIATASFGLGIVIVNPADLFSVAQGERYNFLPLVLLGLTLLALAMRPGFPGRPVYAALCMLMLFIGAIDYPKPAHDFADGPEWPDEVRAWRNNHDYQPAVWPRPWTADLSDHARPCSPLMGDLARSTDPRYCESGWIAGYYRHH